jgi:hypothetical protein
VFLFAVILPVEYRAEAADPFALISSRHSQESSASHRLEGKIQTIDPCPDAFFEKARFD